MDTPDLLAVRLAVIASDGYHLIESSCDRLWPR